MFKAFCGLIGKRTWLLSFCFAVCLKLQVTLCPKSESTGAQKILWRRDKKVGLRILPGKDGKEKIHMLNIALQSHVIGLVCKVGGGYYHLPGSRVETSHAASLSRLIRCYL